MVVSKASTSFWDDRGTCARVHWCNRASLGRQPYCCVARRIRTIRSSPCSYDTVELSSMLEFSPLHNATCFKYDCPGRCVVPTPTSRSHGYVAQNSFYDDSEKTSGESFSTGTIEYVLCGCINVVVSVVDHLAICRQLDMGLRGRATVWVGVVLPCMHARVGGVTNVQVPHQRVHHPLRWQRVLEVAA